MLTRGGVYGCKHGNRREGYFGHGVRRHAGISDYGIAYIKVNGGLMEQGCETYV